MSCAAKSRAKSVSNKVKNSVGIYDPRTLLPFRDFVIEEIKAYSAEVTFLQQQLDALKDKCGYKFDRLVLHHRGSFQMRDEEFASTYEIGPGLVCPDKETIRGSWLQMSAEPNGRKVLFSRGGLGLECICDARSPSWVMDQKWEKTQPTEHFYLLNNPMRIALTLLPLSVRKWMNTTVPLLLPWSRLTNAPRSATSLRDGRCPLCREYRLDD